MGLHKNGCIICGKDLKYFNPAKKLVCAKCGKEFEATASCEDGHFICDACHAQAGYEHITSVASHTDSKNPILIAREMMQGDGVNMHGPEHHYLVIAALLAAYKNSGGQIDLEKSLQLARERSRKVPGGICGFWGCCGAAVGSGIFISIVTGSTPLSEKEWSLANKMTSLSLDSISQNGGPRCCKRDTKLAILSAIRFARENLHIEMEQPEIVTCSFFGGNPSCKKEECLFYPQKG
ncbi:MAG: DUF5714 domain-containing protein [Deltaproteobacteria bacterium]|nr:DUF5714 domain-containing protein [Deltaproteobacteria bacterium]